MHPVRRCNRIAFANPPFTAHVDPRLAMAADDPRRRTGARRGIDGLTDQALPMGRVRYSQADAATSAEANKIAAI